MSSTLVSPTAAPPPTSTPTQTSSGSSPTSSPLLFFVALGFGVVFTNLWIIVGVKYCFRYNARNRALRAGEDADPINLENMPTRPHRRRREKKLMTMEEVNERFPLTKYKNWVAARISEGLPTNGGITAPPSRAASVREVDGVEPASPVGTKHSVDIRPATATSETEGIMTQPTENTRGESDRKSLDATITEKDKPEVAIHEDKEEHHHLEEVQTSVSTIDNKHATIANEEEDDEDDHIHDAIPPELLNNPGDSCAICIDALEEDDDVRGLTCGHAFHASCLDPWLTSRRACCPLCKADYYTPKPRPEGEQEPERTSRRSHGTRANMPQQPQSTWGGIRGNSRFVIGRFGAASSRSTEPPTRDERQSRRSRRVQEETNTARTPENNVETSSRWAPRISNPFSSLRIPGRGSNRPADTQPANTEPSPSQLEAGVR